LLRGVASALHEKHEAELPESEVVQHFAAMLTQMGQPQEDALRIVHEIRDRSGLLVERRPGSFAFSHLTFQEYLTALDYASRTQELLAHADDPWWHEVIALAAGIPGCNSAEIIGCFLGKGKPEDIFIATKCLETAVSVPLKLRRKVESAVERVLLPRAMFSELMTRLPEIGSTVAPLLARVLADTSELSAWMTASDFFTSFVYEPVIPILMQRASETTQTQGSLIVGTGTGKDYHINVGEFAVFVLSAMAGMSDRARVGLISLLSKEDLSEEFLDWLDRRMLLADDFKPSRRGKRAPKLAGNTG
jgi:hypothetical protein